MLSRSGATSRAFIVAVFTATVGTLVVVSASEGQVSEAECHTGEHKAVAVGIVKATACWTESENSDGQTIYTARYADQPSAHIDLNGFIVTGTGQSTISSGLQINTETRQVRAGYVATETSGNVKPGDFVGEPAQLKTYNWPFPGQYAPLGDPIKLDFIAPLNEELLLEDLRFGVNSDLAQALSGLSPFGTIEAPIKLKPGGTGSMDISILLAGYFTLKGKPQSVTIGVATEPEEGTKFDGVEVKLKEIDAIKAFVINDLEATYQREANRFAGSANVSLPFFSKGVGAGVGVGIQNGVLTDMSVSLHGVDIPIGATGKITDLAGGFSFQGESPLDLNGYCKSEGYEGVALVGPERGTWAIANWKCHKGTQNDSIDVDKACRWQSKNPGAHAEYRDPSNANSWKCVGMNVSHLEDPNIQLDLLINANASAVFGSPRTSPFGKIEPFGVDAGLQAGYTGEGLLVKINGGVKFFRIPVGNAHLTLHANAGIDVGFGVGVGFPSYSDNPNDPFYVGLGVDGWIGKGMFQAEGRGGVRLFGVDIAGADGLVNDQAVGGCWKLLGLAGGAVYKYGDRVRDFGINSCGLGDYREQFPGDARSLAATDERTFTLSGEKGTLDVDGAGAAPRFTLRSDDGRVYRTPEEPGHLANDHAFFMNEYTNSTHVLLRDSKGTWTISPHEGSTITGVRAAGEAPRERVTAEVRGKGRSRTLVWDSLNRPNTRLVFTEVLPDGPEIPILRTDDPSGRKTFSAAGRYYGKRDLQVTVLHGHGSIQSPTVDRYQVNRPALLPAPRRVAGERHDHDVLVEWSGVSGAHGYLVQVTTQKRGKVTSSYVRRVAANRRRVRIPDHPGGADAEAAVFALNRDGRPGVVGKDEFPTNPAVKNLGRAAKLDVRSAVVSGNAVHLRTECPKGGHCDTRAKLLLNGRQIASTRYQQTPDTFHTARLTPRRSDARSLRRHASDLQVIVDVDRSREHGRARGPVSG